MICINSIPHLNSPRFTILLLGVIGDGCRLCEGDLTGLEIRAPPGLRASAFEPACLQGWDKLPSILLSVTSES